MLINYGANDNRSVVGTYNYIVVYHDRNTDFGKNTVTNENVT